MIERISTSATCAFVEAIWTANSMYDWWTMPVIPGESAIVAAAALGVERILYLPILPRSPS